MKVLMFGWEFSPNIFGKLGSVCYGLTQGLSKLNDMKESYVVLKISGGENKSIIKLIGAIKGSIINRKVKLKEFGQSVEYIKVSSKLETYVDPEAYRPKTTYRVKGANALIERSQQGETIFAGKYSTALLSQINRMKWDDLALESKMVYRSAILINSIGMN